MDLGSICPLRECFNVRATRWRSFVAVGACQDVSIEHLIPGKIIITCRGVDVNVDVDENRKETPILYIPG